MKTKDMMVGAMLTALSILIPVSFGAYLRIYIPPFSATLGSHVPLFMAITVSPLVGAMVGVGSALGFLLILGPIVGARACIHILLGYVGAKLFQKNQSLIKTLLYILPLHALGEALIVLPFGFDPYTAFVIVGIGTGLHHLMDTIIAVILFKTLRNILPWTKRDLA